MNGEILLQLASMFMFTTDLPPQGWVFVILVLFGDLQLFVGCLAMPR